MKPDFPIYLSIFFVVTTLLTIVLFYFASKSKAAVGLLLLWSVLQSVLALSGLYQDVEALPPNMMLFGIFPALVFIILMFASPQGRAFMDRIDLQMLTRLHTVRVVVEVGLTLLFHAGLMSIYITFEGTNFDILSGITAPLVAILAFRYGKINKKLLLTWNILALLLLLNVVITAVFAIPSPLQRIAFEQPNVAVLFFPFCLLPTLIVPVVLFSHLAAIRKLLINR